MPNELAGLYYCPIETLVNEELSKMPVEALKEYFRDNESSLGEIYHHAIKFLLLSPRDVKRLFNRLCITETTVRGGRQIPAGERIKRRFFFCYGATYPTTYAGLRK